MQKPSLIIFDCDGVIVDSEPITNAFLLDDLSRHGLQLTMADCDHLFVGGTIKGAAEVARKMGADLADDWVENYYLRVHKHLEMGVPLVSGFLDVLAKVEESGIPHCIVSNGPVEKMRITLGQNGLWDRFQNRTFSAHTYGTAKPDPELFHIAARQFNVAPKDCVAIDDSPSGCTGAANASIPCIGYAERTNSERLATTGAKIIRSMAELPPLLGLG